MYVFRIFQIQTEWHHICPSTAGLLCRDVGSSPNINPKNPQITLRKAREQMCRYTPIPFELHL